MSSSAWVDLTLWMSQIRRRFMITHTYTENRHIVIMWMILWLTLTSSVLPWLKTFVTVLLIRICMNAWRYSFAILRWETLVYWSHMQWRSNLVLLTVHNSFIKDLFMSHQVHMMGTMIKNQRVSQLSKHSILSQAHLSYSSRLIHMTHSQHRSTHLSLKLMIHRYQKQKVQWSKPHQLFPVIRSHILLRSRVNQESTRRSRRNSLKQKLLN